ncbi:MAG: single-stranded DNA-binding protein [Ornithinimicrobium sp.]|uniref:single-stranded DNA-binding protein n=1 Tax=Ornithinimicrobium sp. TaxID=1977084 RepID=UPI0026E082B6|nr:single-stranded DNA-binding protein [Ornithinimicrobium sp.]MDO5738543.1 single-stranded DNA-binding protein [Ornithinimicrobium sp.]
MTKKQPAAPTNEVRLIGRVSGDPTARTLPSGDELVHFRVVVPRPPRAGDGGKRQVDTIDVACWAARVRTSAKKLPDGQGVEILGSLRRRFFASGATRSSRYEVEATRLRRVGLT